MHALEKQALEDPFLAEALEGYSQNLHTGNDLSILQRQLHERIMLLQENKKVYDFTWQRLSVAAAAAVLFISAGILFWMNTQKQALKTASNHKEVEANLTSLDTINKLRNLSDKQKEVDSESYKSSPNAVLEAVPENKITSVKRHYTIRLPQKEITASRTYPQSDSNIIVLAEPSLSTNTPINDASSNGITNQLQGKVAGVAKSKDKSENLDEVVVVGYGAQRKKDITGSVTTLSTNNLNKAISGKIVSNGDKQPLSGVSVKLKGSSKATTTNVNGEFSLYLDSLAGTLQIAYIGYNTTEIKAKAGQDVSIALSENTGSLSEVVVVGYGRSDSEEKREVTINYAQPLNGWRAYNKYLATAAKNPKGVPFTSGKVKISFDVNENGELTNFIILKGLTDTYNTEAVRIIKEGPKWDSRDKSNSKGLVTINFKKL